MRDIGKKIPVGILGATGTVGQKFITLLSHHPYFEIKSLVASERSAGKKYREACGWKQQVQLPAEIGDMNVLSLEHDLDCTILFSGLDSSVAGHAESRYAEKGHWVISNSKNHRMDPDVPLVIPEINPDHYELVRQQKTPGKIITNPNCSTMFLAMVLAPLHSRFGIDAVSVTTMQAVSGAGYPGVSSLDILGNVIPLINGEEEKMETETVKILGKPDGTGIRDAAFTVSAQCSRVPVIDGHMETAAVRLEGSPDLQEVTEVLENFRGLPQEHNLPSAPARPVIVLDDPAGPQPLRDLPVYGGMSAIVGRLRYCPVMGMKMVILGHNTIRGAAGAAVLNGEALLELGYFE
ncbi:MAG: aspartate-semialdehyde dehydrogenase [Spirochaetia bacterium]